MSDWKDIGSNIIKLEGYGIYVTYIDSEYYMCEMLTSSGLPPLDPDGCIDWDPFKDPANQKLLNIMNARFGTCLTMPDFGLTMGIRDIKEHSRVQKEIKGSKKKS
jgi:hypothetical protein